MTATEDWRGSTTSTHNQKADFTSIYNQPDPRAYFATLGPLCYSIPQQALPLFNRLLDSFTHGGKVLDVCCSYGINAALLRCDVDYDTLQRHYAESQLLQLSPEQQLALDEQFFAARMRRPDLTVFGLDAAPNAIRYATSVGLLPCGWAEDLEAHEPSAPLHAALREVALVICTGGVGYIGAPTFARIASAVADPQNLCVVSFVLRVFSYDDVAAALARSGLVTERLSANGVAVAFPQRRFASEEEQRAAVADVVARGLDPAGMEAEGWFYAECYVSRSASAAAQLPMTELLACVDRRHEEN